MLCLCQHLIPRAKLIDSVKHKTNATKSLKNIYDLFDLKHCNNETVENIKIVNGPIIWDDVYNILKQDGFIFPSKL